MFCADKGLERADLKHKESFQKTKTSLEAEHRSIWGLQTSSVIEKGQIDKHREIDTFVPNSSVNKGAISLQETLDTYFFHAWMNIRFLGVFY